MINCPSDLRLISRANSFNAYEICEYYEYGIEFLYGGTLSDCIRVIRFHSLSVRDMTGEFDFTVIDCNYGRNPQNNIT